MTILAPAVYSAIMKDRALGPIDLGEVREGQQKGPHTKDPIYAQELSGVSCLG